MKKTVKSTVLDYVESCGGIINRKGLVKFLVELNGLKFDYKKQRGWLSMHLQTTGHHYPNPCGVLTELPTEKKGYYMRPSKCDSRYLVKISRGIYKLVK